MPHQQPIYRHQENAAKPKPQQPAMPVAQTRLAEPTLVEPIQREETPKRTGLPDHLKSGIENLSGYSMDDVRVHYNSAKPAQLNAHAYAQGTDIHVAPGQERHLPHEAWHVVQQKQRRVKVTRQLRSKLEINDDPKLEREADVMGKKALQFKNDIPISFREDSEDKSTSNFNMRLSTIKNDRNPLQFDDGKGGLRETLDRAVDAVESGTRSVFHKVGSGVSRAVEAVSSRIPHHRPQAEVVPSTLESYRAADPLIPSRPGVHPYMQDDGSFVPPAPSVSPPPTGMVVEPSQVFPAHVMTSHVVRRTDHQWGRSPYSAHSDISDVPPPPSTRLHPTGMKSPHTPLAPQGRRVTSGVHEHPSFVPPPPSTRFEQVVHPTRMQAPLGPAVVDPRYPTEHIRKSHLPRTRMAARTAMGVAAVATGNRSLTRAQALAHHGRRASSGALHGFRQSRGPVVDSIAAGTAPPGIPNFPQMPAPVLVQIVNIAGAGAAGAGVIFGVWDVGKGTYRFLKAVSLVNTGREIEHMANTEPNLTEDTRDALRAFGQAQVKRGGRRMGSEAVGIAIAGASVAVGILALLSLGFPVLAPFAAILGLTVALVSIAWTIGSRIVQNYRRKNYHVKLREYFIDLYLAKQHHLLPSSVLPLVANYIQFHEQEGKTKRVKENKEALNTKCKELVSNRKEAAANLLLNSYIEGNENDRFAILEAISKTSGKKTKDSVERHLRYDPPNLQFAKSIIMKKLP